MFSDQLVAGGPFLFFNVTDNVFFFRASTDKCFLTWISQLRPFVIFSLKKGGIHVAGCR